MAENKGFDLAAMLSGLDVPNSGTGRKQIAYVDIDLIDDDQKNFYETAGIESLADNIAMFGLMEPILVRQNPDAPDRYMVTSGHRRRLALRMLKEKEPEKWKEAPVIIDEAIQSDALQQLKLIFANRDNRKYSSADQMEEAAQVETLLYKLAEEEGYAFPGRMRDYVAKIVGTNKTKLGRLKYIKEHLAGYWMELFKADKINESVADALAHMPENQQKIMFNAWKDNPGRMWHDNVTAAAKRFDSLFASKCEKDVIGTCFRNCSARIAKIAKLDYWEKSCSGCCLNCTELASCKAYCLYAEEKHKKLAAEIKAAKAEEKAAEKERIAPALDYIRGVYGRFRKALNFAGIPVRKYFEECGGFFTGRDIELVDQYTFQPQKIQSEVTRLPFVRSIFLGDIKCLVATADVLGCSIDWLLGREVPGPGEAPDTSSVTADAVPPSPQGEGFGWKTGEPEKEGKYVAITFDEYSQYTDILEWKDGLWLGLAKGESVTLWTPMPED